LSFIARTVQIFNGKLNNEQAIKSNSVCESNDMHMNARSIACTLKKEDSLPTIALAAKRYCNEIVKVVMSALNRMSV
jgi:hypothetical protein